MPHNLVYGTNIKKSDLHLQGKKKEDMFLSTTYTASHPKRPQSLHFPRLLRKITYCPHKACGVMFSDKFQIITFLQYAYLICTLMMCIWDRQWAPYKDAGWPTSHDAQPPNIPDAFPCTGGCSQQMCPLKHPSQTQICGHWVVVHGASSWLGLGNAL